MPIPLGILAAAGRSQAPAGAFQLLESTVLTGSQASVEFTNLATKYAATYQHLQLRLVTRTTEGSTLRQLRMQVNSDTGTNYSTHLILGDSNAPNPYPSFGASVNYIVLYYTNAANNAANAFGAGVIDLLDPFETTKFKTVRTFGGQTGYSLVTLNSGAWRNTNALTSVNIFPEGGHSFGQFSRFSLYGIKATA